MSLFVVLASSGAVLARILKQPIIIGYLFAGILLSTTGVLNLDYTESLSGLGQIGVTLLLFLIGLEMNVSELPSIGKTAFVAGMGQIIFTSFVGFWLALLLGFTPLVAVYIALALTFSSTIISVKLLGEKNDTGSLYGKIAVGLLLVQDVIAILVLMFLAGVKSGNTSVVSTLLILAKGLILLVLIRKLSRKTIPGLFEKLLGPSPELVFVGSIAWALGVASLVGGPLGFTLEVGGFLAGLALSNLPEHLEVASKVRPLRDFFLALFFLYLGTTLKFDDLATVLFPAVVLSLFVLVGKLVIVAAIMGSMGYRRRTSFLASVNVSQISEFSLIIMAMGLGLGHITSPDMSMVVLVGVVTMSVSTYLILNSEKVFDKIKHRLTIFEKKKTQEPSMVLASNLIGHIVLFGAHRTGAVLTDYFNKKKIAFVVVDFNPEVEKAFSLSTTPLVFGDMGDYETLDLLCLSKARLVISTVPTLEDNKKLLEYMRNKKASASTIICAKTKSDARILTMLGATKVIVPEVVAGQYIKSLLAKRLVPEMLKT